MAKHKIFLHSIFCLDAQQYPKPQAGSWCTGFHSTDWRGQGFFPIGVLLSPGDLEIQVCWGLSLVWTGNCLCGVAIAGLCQPALTLFCCCIFSLTTAKYFNGNADDDTMSPLSCCSSIALSEHPIREPEDRGYLPVSGWEMALVIPCWAQQSGGVWWQVELSGCTQRVPMGQQWSLLSKVLPKGWPWQSDRWVFWIVCLSWTLLGLCAVVPHQGAQQCYTNDLWWSNHNLAFSYGCTLCIDFQENKSIYFSLFSTSVLKEGY